MQRASIVVVSLYPQIAITASIFMTVAIALERFIAVHYPLNYSQVIYIVIILCKQSRKPFAMPVVYPSPI